MNLIQREHFPSIAERRTVASGRSKAGALAASALLVSFGAGEAYAQSSDPWTSPDKAMHFAASAPLGAIAASLSGPSASTGMRLLYGTLIGSLPGLAKELADSRNVKADASSRDMVFNVAGAALGALLADWVLIKPMASTGRDRVDGVTIEYKIEF